MGDLGLGGLPNFKTSETPRNSSSPASKRTKGLTAVFAVRASSFKRRMKKILSKGTSSRRWGGVSANPSVGVDCSHVFIKVESWL